MMTLFVALSDSLECKIYGREVVYKHKAACKSWVAQWSNAFIYALASHLKAFQLLFINDYCPRGFRMVSLHNMLYKFWPWPISFSEKITCFTDLKHILKWNWKLQTIWSRVLPLPIYIVLLFTITIKM